MRARGCYSKRSTYERVRAACSPYSTIDVELHAQHVADVAREARAHASRELLTSRTRESRRR